jgi:hypothetical protein
MKLAKEMHVLISSRDEDEIYEIHIHDFLSQACFHVNHGHVVFKEFNSDKKHYNSWFASESD